MELPEPAGRTFSVLISEIEKGEIKIPQFQREFIWDLKKPAKLMDSIIKGYPISTFIFWRTKERLRAIRNLGNFELPSLAQGDEGGADMNFAGGIIHREGAQDGDS